MYRHALIANDPLLFGRGRRYVQAASVQPRASDDMRLFAMTFAAGFLFTTLFIV